MHRLRELIRRFFGTLKRSPHDAQLEEEIRAHLEFAAEEMERRGSSPEDARRQARLQYGHPAQAMDAMRDQGGLPWLDGLGQDVRHGLRVLRKSPTFTIVAVLTLALGIGANTAIFSIVNGVLLRPLGYPKPEQLMFVSTRFAGSLTEFWVSAPEYIEFRNLNRSFSAVGAYLAGEANLTAGDRARRVRAAYVDEHLLDTLAIPPQQGRLFAAGETDTIGTPIGPNPALPPAIAILSHELWQAAFGEQPLVGKTIEVDARRYQVLGVMPPGADLMDDRPEIWLPLGINDINRQSRANHYLNLIGRLKDGVTVQSAQAELNTLMENWGERVGVKPGPGAAGHVFYPYKDGDGHLLQMKPLGEQIVGGVSRAIWVLQAAVGLVLLIACANLANLLLARAQTREREFALRTVLGAGSGRLFRQLMTEGVLLSIAGGVLGLLFARLGMYALAQAHPASLPRTNDISVDRLVLLFSFSVSVATGVIFGLVPLLHKRARGLADGLKESRSKGSIGGARHQLRRGLVIGEAALALMLVISAGLLVRTIFNINRIDAGFDRSRLTTFSLTLPQATYLLPSSRLRTFQPLLEKLRAVPGIQSATAMSGLPPDRPLNEVSIRVENYTSHSGGPTENADYLQYVFTDYFETMGIPIVSGRSFEPTDTESSGPVVVVNETFAKTFWEGQNPIGRRVQLDITDQAPWWTVIGVAKDVKQGGVDRKTGREVYVFLPQKPRSTFQTMNVVLRTSLPAEALAQNIENVVHQVDRAVPVTRFREMNAVFADSVQRPRLLAELVAVFAGLALLLAAIGTYGVLSYVVTERRREIGIRLALGADRRNVLGHIMKEGLLLTSIGVAAGLIGAFATNRLMVSLLFGVRPTDTTTVTMAAMTIALVAATACWLPAWRASRLDPNAVLRDE